MNNQEGWECVCVLGGGGSGGEERNESLMRLKRARKTMAEAALGSVLLQSHPFDYSQKDC